MKIKLTLAIFLLIVISVKAQIYTPSGVIQGATSNNNIGIGTSTAIGKLDIYTGLTAATSSIAGIPTGTFSFGNNGSAAIPTLFSKSSNSVGMSLFTGTNETNASPDMRFVVMEQTGKDYLPSNLTSTAFRFSRFNQTLVDILRNGNVGIGTSSPIGKLNILTGNSGLTYDVVSQPIGSISFANGSASNPVPIMVGKGNNNAGLYFLGATTNGNTNADILFDVRNNTDNDFTDLTKTAYRFRRYGIPLVDILRNGNVGIGTTSPFGKLDVVGSKTSTYISSLNSPTYDFLRIAIFMEQEVRINTLH